jgi:hypothetical protein
MAVNESEWARGNHDGADRLHPGNLPFEDFHPTRSESRPTSSSSRICYHRSLFCKSVRPPASTKRWVLLPLIVVNCLILGRAECSPAENGVRNRHGWIGMGFGFTLRCSQWAPSVCCLGRVMDGTYRPRETVYSDRIFNLLPRIPGVLYSDCAGKLPDTRRVLKNKKDFLLCFLSGCGRMPPTRRMKC